MVFLHITHAIVALIKVKMQFTGVANVLNFRCDCSQSHVKMTFLSRLLFFSLFVCVWIHSICNGICTSSDTINIMHTATANAQTTMSHLFATADCDMQWIGRPMPVAYCNQSKASWIEEACSKLFEILALCCLLCVCVRACVRACVLACVCISFFVSIQIRWKCDVFDATI